MASGTGSESSASTYHGEAPLSGRRTPMCFSLKPMAVSLISSKADSRLPLISCISERSETAASGDGTAMNAVSWDLGFG